MDYFLEPHTGIMGCLTEGALNYWNRQGSKKVLLGHPGQAYFPAGQVTFHSHLPAGQEIRQAVCQLNHEFKKH